MRFVCSLFYPLDQLTIQTKANYRNLHGITKEKKIAYIYLVLHWYYITLYFKGDLKHHYYTYHTRQLLLYYNNCVFLSKRLFLLETHPGNFTFLSNTFSTTTTNRIYYTVANVPETRFLGPVTFKSHKSLYRDDRVAILTDLYAYRLQLRDQRFRPIRSPGKNDFPPEGLGNTRRVSPHAHRRPRPSSYLRRVENIVKRCLSCLFFRTRLSETRGKMSLNVFRTRHCRVR